jgi:hypothetical protein
VQIRQCPLDKFDEAVILAGKYITIQASRLFAFEFRANKDLYVRLPLNGPSVIGIPNNQVSHSRKIVQATSTEENPELAYKERKKPR